MAIIGLAIVVLLFALGTPIWIALFTGALYLLVIVLGVPTTIIPITMFGSVDTFTLMAIPLFLVAGNIMAYGGSSPYIFDVMNRFAGKFRAGIPVATIMTAMVFGAITGSTAATLAGINSICLPNLRKAGYSDVYSASLMACSATLGQLIPPSILMIVYGTLSLTNVGDLFISGILPGIVTGAALGVVAWIKSPKVRNVALQDPSIYSWKSRGEALWKGLPALLMPVISLGGIYSGILTPTEAGAVSCVYGVIISVFVYRKMSLASIKRTLEEASYSNSMVFLLMASSLVIALPLTYMQIPQTVAKLVVGAGLTGTPLMIVVTLIYLIMGCFIDSLPIVYLVLPIVLPALQAGGVNLIHFNVVTVVAMLIGQITPPFGSGMYLAAKMVGAPVAEVIKGTMGYLAAMIIVLIVLIFVPQISLLLLSL